MSSSKSLVTSSSSKVAPTSATVNTKTAAKPSKLTAPIHVLVKASRADVDTVWDKEEFLDAIYWMRVAFALVFGLTCGLLPLKGLLPFLVFMGVAYGVPIAWMNSLRIDDEEYGGQAVIINEGAPPCISLFILLWVVTYTWAHAT